MPPIAKDNELLTATPEASVRPGSPAVLSGDTSSKPQPVALEVAVTVNGARTVDGSDKREPFSESTKTVLVFGNGAVIRLSSSVVPGQLLFLTNEKSKKEVVCQVVKSKNYRNVSGYVELEFTEPVVGFWGMRFPGDRIGSPSQPVAPAPVAVSSPAASGSLAVHSSIAPKIQASLAIVAPKVVEVKPAAPAASPTDLKPNAADEKFFAPPPQAGEVSATSKLESPLLPKSPAPIAPVAAVPTISATQAFASSLAPEKPAASAPSLFDAPISSERQASILEPSPVPATPSTLNLGNLAPFFEVKPATPPAVLPPPVPSSGDPESEALKQQTARLQEQLSSLLFTDKAPAKPAQDTPAVPVVEKKELAETAAKVLEIAKAPEPAPLPPKLSEPAKIAPAPRKSSLEDEELQIPAWLEPLARNAAAPLSTQELIEREKAKRLTEQAKVEEVAVEPLAPAEQEKVFELPAPSFDNSLAIEENHATGQSGSRSTGKGLLIGAIAAGVLLLAGAGVWYIRQQPGGVPANKLAAAVQPAAVSVPAESLPVQANSATQPDSRTPSKVDPAVKTPAQNNISSNPSTVETVSMSTPEVRTHQAASLPTRGDVAVVNPDLSPPAPAQTKKPILGEVHLATPTVTQRGKTQGSGDAGVGLALNEMQVAPEGDGESLGAGLTGSSKQPIAPTAPVPVGGDVKQARLVSSVPPQYPVLAKNQRVSGDVRIDALIDATGRVTTMKVISGPALLHQAAMDALRQWKYQPASLDGKPVAMHLTVVLQFRLQ